MSDGVKTIIYPVKDIARAKKLFGLLAGAKPVVDEPYYAGFQLGDQHVGLDPNGHTDGALGYWHVPDIRESMALLRQAGAETHQEVRDVGGGRLIGSVRDADGNLIGLLQTS